MKIIVTGGAGFIGSHVVDKYIALGHNVIVIDDLSTGKLKNINSKAKFYKTDIRSSEIANIFKTEKPDIVNHHAAQISVPDSVKNPVLDAEINAIGLLNILENSDWISCKRDNEEEVPFCEESANPNIGKKSIRSADASKARLQALFSFPIKR